MAQIFSFYLYRSAQFNAMLSLHSNSYFTGGHFSGDDGRRRFVHNILKRCGVILS